MTARSEQFRRFEYSTALTPIAKQVQRTALQADIDAWLAAGNRIQEAPPLVVQPRRSRPVFEVLEVNRPASTKKRRFNSYTDAEIALVRKLKADGMTHQDVAEILTERFGVKRTRNSVEHLCIDYGIPSKYVRRAPRTKRPIDEVHNAKRRKSK